MKESRLVSKIIEAAEKIPKTWYYKVHGSIFSHVGIPDVIGVTSGQFWAVEAKIEQNGLSMIQRVILEKIRAAGGRCGVARSVDDALAIIEGRSTPQTDSPMEFLFLQEAQSRLPGLVSQYPVPPYVIDFAIPNKKTLIEIDGKDFHDPIRDAKKDAYLQAQGWNVIRLTGAQVYADPVLCVLKIQEIIGAAS